MEIRTLICSTWKPAASIPSGVLVTADWQFDDRLRAATEPLGGIAAELETLDELIRRGPRHGGGTRSAICAASSIRGGSGWCPAIMTTQAGGLTTTPDFRL